MRTRFLRFRRRSGTLHLRRPATRSTRPQPMAGNPTRPRASSSSGWSSSPTRSSAATTIPDFALCATMSSSLVARFAQCELQGLTTWAAAGCKLRRRNAAGLQDSAARCVCDTSDIANDLARMTGTTRRRPPSKSATRSTRLPTPRSAAKFTVRSSSGAAASTSLRKHMSVAAASMQAQRKVNIACQATLQHSSSIGSARRSAASSRSSSTSTPTTSSPTSIASQGDPDDAPDLLKTLRDESARATQFYEGGPSIVNQGAWWAAHLASSGTSRAIWLRNWWQPLRGQLLEYLRRPLAGHEPSAAAAAAERRSPRCPLASTRSASALVLQWLPA